MTENASQRAEDPADAAADQQTPTAEPTDRSTDSEADESANVREEMVQRLLKGLRETQSSAAIGDFLAVEFTHDPPTEAEKAEAHRRYVDELAKNGLAELGDQS